MSEYTYKISAAGRVNLIGEHVDYCGGKVLPCALSLKNTVYVRPNGTDNINVEWATLQEKVSMPLNDMMSFRQHPHARYVAGCAYLWRQAGHDLKGCDMYLNCTVPFGSGLSSSAAIEVSVLAAFAALCGEDADKVEIARIAQHAEQQFVGVNCGIMDQYAAACGKKNNAMLLDCATLVCQYIPVNFFDCSLVLIDSKKPHDLSESKYNERRAETEEALRILQRKFHVDCLAQVTREQLALCRDMLSPTVYKRAKHVVEECQRVQFAATALKNGYLDAFGVALNASHKSLSELYEVTGSELDALARAAQRHPACLGSRMTGAGFGGCTVSLVKTAQAEDFKRYVLAQYKRETGYDAVVYQAEISDGIVCKKL